MDERTIDAYNKMAKEYDEETADFWNLFPRTFIDTFVRLSKRKILDVGSGPGRDGLFLQEAGKDVTCLDAAEGTVKLSSAKGLTLLRGSFNSLPFEDRAFSRNLGRLNSPLRCFSENTLELRESHSLAAYLSLILIL